MEDNKIIELFFRRSEQALEEVALKYGAITKQLAIHILHDPQDAEECINDAYLAAWNSIPPQKPETLSAYLCRLVRNLAIKKYHYNTAAKRNSNYDVALCELENCFPSSASVEGSFDAAETAQSINAFLGKLDRKDRLLFVRRYWYADSVEALAKLLHVKPHAVSVRLYRIREKLKKHLAKEGISI
ncbi:MAG: sigma-70 family RNA polymerase sigma factor [Oscillospiraceae bacterium]|nr:sigma-70 family RNA polymerase sigma factor [Oscillospiraceae bacterium]